MVLRIQVFDDIVTTASSTLYTRTNFNNWSTTADELARFQLSIGRHEATDIHFTTDKSVSRQHCKLVVQDDDDSDDGASATLTIETPGKSGSFLAVPKLPPPSSKKKQKKADGDATDDDDEDATDDEEDIAVTSQLQNTAPSVGSLPPPPPLAPVIADYYQKQHHSPQEDDDDDEQQGMSNTDPSTLVELQRLPPTHSMSLLPNQPVFIQLGRNAKSTLCLTYIPRLTFCGSKLKKDQAASLKEKVPSIGAAWTDIPTKETTPHFMVVPGSSYTPCTKQLLAWALGIPFCTAAWLEQVLEQSSNDAKLWPAVESPTASETSRFWTDVQCDPLLLSDFVLLTSMSKKSNEEERSREIKELAQAVGMQLTNRVTKALLEQGKIVVSIQASDRAGAVKTPKKKNIPMVPKEALARAITTQTRALVDVDGNVLQVEKEEEEEEEPVQEEEEDDPDKTILLDSPVVAEKPKPKKMEMPAVEATAPATRRSPRKAAARTNESSSSSTQPTATATTAPDETDAAPTEDAYKTPAPSSSRNSRSSHKNKRRLEEVAPPNEPQDDDHDDDAFKTPAPSKRSKVVAQSVEEEEQASSPEPVTETKKTTTKKSSRKTPSARRKELEQNDVDVAMDVEEATPATENRNKDEPNENEEMMVEEPPKKKKAEKAKRPMPPTPAGLEAASSDGWFVIAPSDRRQRAATRKRNIEPIQDELDLPPPVISLGMKIPSADKMKATKESSSSKRKLFSSNGFVGTGAFPRRKGVRDFKCFRKNTVIPSTTHRRRRVLLVSILPKETEAQMEAQRHQDKLEYEQRRAEDLFKEGSDIVQKRRKRV